MRALMGLVLSAGLVAGFSVTASATESTRSVASNTNSSSISIAMTRDYDGRNLKVLRKLSENSAYTRYQATYKSGDLKICGILIEPKGKGPFPMVVLAHGYIDPKVYVTGQGFRREQDWLPRNGYGVLHVDYRNHACSDKDPKNDVNMRLGYAEDVINAGLAIRGSDIPWINNERVAVLGRSMGGGVTYQALAIAPGVFDAAITYASVSSNAADNFNRWQRNNYDIGDKILAKYGEPRDNPDAWRQMSSRNYFFRITEPVLSFHGTADDTCEISWARATKRALDAAGVENELVEYKGAGHYFYSPWNNSIKRVGTFLDKHLA